MAIEYSIVERIDFYTSFPANTMFFAIFAFVFLVVYAKNDEKKFTYRMIIASVAALVFCAILILILSYVTSGVHDGI
ncbi:hypothetical protein [Enterobacter asburiae]|uniref:hypothetical protein n=1 Tax=Enterobacter asburiae TaxID=61645 RepID=UPI0004A3450F|nr:hypothetical protein [Enterobacter asburiae]